MAKVAELSRTSLQGARRVQLLNARPARHRLFGSGLAIVVAAFRASTTFR